jgi:acetyl-CoA acetyltransferase
MNNSIIHLKYFFSNIRVYITKKYPINSASSRSSLSQLMRLEILFVRVVTAKYAAIASIHVGNAFGELQRQQAHLGAMVAQVVPELWGVPAMRHEGACASSSLGVLSAMAEIEAGRYDCVLVLGVEEFKNLPGNVASQNQNAAAAPVDRIDGALQGGRVVAHALSFGAELFFRFTSGDALAGERIISV